MGQGKNGKDPARFPYKFQLNSAGSVRTIILEYFWPNDNFMKNFFQDKFIRDIFLDSLCLVVEISSNQSREEHELVKALSHLEK